jgi:hypothetical protein
MDRGGRVRGAPGIGHARSGHSTTARCPGVTAHPAGQGKRAAVPANRGTCLTFAGGQGAGAVRARRRGEVSRPQPKPSRSRSVNNRPRRGPMRLPRPAGPRGDQPTRDGARAGHRNACGAVQPGAARSPREGRSPPGRIATPALRCSLGRPPTDRGSRAPTASARRRAGRDCRRCPPSPPSRAPTATGCSKSAPMPDPARATRRAGSPTRRPRTRGGRRERRRGGARGRPRRRRSAAKNRRAAKGRLLPAGFDARDGRGRIGGDTSPAARLLGTNGDSPSFRSGLPRPAGVASRRRRRSIDSRATRRRAGFGRGSPPASSPRARDALPSRQGAADCGGLGTGCTATAAGSGW